MLDRDEVKQLILLSDSYVLSALDDQERLDLAVSGEALSYAQDQVIVSQGDAGDAFFLVQTGRVRVTTIRDGAPSEVAVLGRGSCFGEMALLTGSARTATVTAAEPSKVVRYKRADIDAVLARNPAIRQALDILTRRRQGSARG